MEFSYSSIQAFKNCRKYYYYKYIEKLTPKVQRVSLLIGETLHFALEAYYSHKCPEVVSLPAFSRIIQNWALSVPEIAILKVVYDSFTPDTEELKEGLYITIGMVAGYFLTHKPNEFGEMETELEIKVPIGEDEFVGRLDGKTERYGIEHKTLGIDFTRYIDRLYYDYQPTGYLWAERDIIGMIYNLIKKPSIRQRRNETHDEFCQRLMNEYIEKPGNYYFRKHIYRSNSELEEFERELPYIITEVKNCECYYKNTVNCTMYGGCEYNILCRDAGENEDLKKEYFEVR